MTGLVVFSVPLYKLFCNLTGFQGFNQNTDALIEHVDPNMGELEMNVIFSSQVNDGLDWNFEAPNKMIITEGVKYDVTFKAKNNSSISTVGTSIFNVLPPKIVPYLLKIECFCFQDQKIQPGEVVEFPVTFYIDPLILEDPELKK